MELAAVTSWATGSFAVIGRCCAQRLGLTVILSIRCFGGAARRAESKKPQHRPGRSTGSGRLLVEAPRRHRPRIVRSDRPSIVRPEPQFVKRKSATSPLVLFWCNSGSGRTLELGRSGRTMLMPAAAGAMRATGSSTTAWSAPLPLGTPGASQLFPLASIAPLDCQRRDPKQASGGARPSSRPPGGIIPLRWATSSRNGGRHHPVTAGDIISL